MTHTATKSATSCCSVVRNTAEMTSAPPAIARKILDHLGWRAVPVRPRVRDPADASFEACAWREADEELGIDLSTHGEVAYQTT